MGSGHYPYCYSYCNFFILSPYLPQDPPSLDAAIQHALAGLYPPFEATAPTILGQVFRLLDSDFGGDGLSFLLDFLIPAKRLCEQVREAACVSWKGCPLNGAGRSLGPLFSDIQESITFTLSLAERRSG